MNAEIVAQIERLIRNMGWLKIRAALPGADQPPRIFEAWVRKSILGYAVQECVVTERGFSWSYQVDSQIRKALGVDCKVRCRMSGAFGYNCETFEVASIAAELMTWKLLAYWRNEGAHVAHNSLQARFEDPVRAMLLQRPDTALEATRLKLEQLYLPRFFDALKEC